MKTMPPSVAWHEQEKKPNLKNLVEEEAGLIFVHEKEVPVLYNFIK